MAKAERKSLSETRKAAFKNLDIPEGNRVILSLDGGGMRGILTLQLLKGLEEQAGIPCYELFDMVAGTSTGAIIAGLITSKHTATEIEQLYDNLVKEVFTKRTFGDRYINPPAYTKKKYRDILRTELGNMTLQQACDATETDLMITSKDMSAAEETFFSCFKTMEDDYYGTYKDVLLRAVMEATMSAPTYWYPLERFVDGGTTTYNNPSWAAIIEATCYSRPKDKEQEPKRKNKYALNELTVLSFGTGISRQFIKPDETLNPKGIDLKFWLDWLLTEIGQDASAMQVDVLRSPAMQKAVDYRRFQISLDPAAISKLPNCDSLNPEKYGHQWLHDMDEKELKGIDMSDLSKYDLVKIIGRQMAQYIVDTGNCFRKDLLDDRGKRDALVTAFGDVVRIRAQMSDPGWLDKFQA